MFVYLKDILLGKIYKQKSNEWKYIIILRIPKLSKNFKSTFYKNKAINNIEDINVNNILVSKKEPYGNKNSFKYFIGYNDNDVIKPLCIRLSQMTGYARKFGENATMPFIVKDKKLLKKYSKI